MDLRELGEFGLIREINKQFSVTDPKVLKGIGDDAAVTELDNKSYLLSTTDTLIEDVHFSPAYTSPFLLGQRSVSVSLSDIAAMGGKPEYLLVSLALPKKLEAEFVTLLYNGIKKQIESFSVKLIGGNTSFSPDKIVITTVVLGVVPKKEVVCRDGANEGDFLYVTGTLGNSALGLKVLEGLKGGNIESSPYGEAVMAHLNPVPRLEMGRTLAKKGLPSAMIDVSDGLLQDLKHLTEESNMGAWIEASKVPTSPIFKKHLRKNPEDNVLSFTGGEDYELLFTSAPSLADEVNKVAKKLSCQVSCIGEIVSSKEGVKVLDEEGSPLTFEKRGFDHFI